jgi:transposase-like protein
MAERRTRRRFTAEFKVEAVKRLLEGGRGLWEVATELGLSPGQLSAWRNEQLAAGSAASSRLWPLSGRTMPWLRCAGSSVPA